MSDDQYRGYVEGMKRDFPEAYREYERIRQNETILSRTERAERIKSDLAEIDPASLTDEQKLIREVYLGNQPETLLRGKDESDWVTLESGSKRRGARKILLRHGGTEATGGLSREELLNIGEVIREGELDKNGFSETANSVRYAYDLNKNGVNLRVVVEELNDGKKVFNYYSNRNITSEQAVVNPLNQTPTAETIPNPAQKNQRLMVVRVLDADEDTLKRIAKLSNDGRLYGEKEKIIANEAKYASKLDDLFNPERVRGPLESESELKNRLGAAEETEANQAAIGRLNDATPNAIDRYMRENSNDIGFKQMIYRNAYALYNLRQAANFLDNDTIDLNVVLPDAIDRMRVAGKNAKQNAEELAADYIERLTKYGGKDVAGNLITANDLAADILGLAFRRFRAMKDEGAIELGRRIDDLIANAREQRKPNLFDGEIAPMDRIDAALDIYGERNSRGLQEAANLVRAREAVENAQVRFNDAKAKLDELKAANADEMAINAARIERTNAAKDLLLARQAGEVSAAIDHKDIGDIDLIWGQEGTGRSDGYGLAKIARRHPEVLSDLQGLLDTMSVVSRSDNRVRLESPTHAAGIRLDYDGDKKKWLMTAFEKRADPVKTTDANGRSADRIEATQLSRSQAQDATIHPTAPESQASRTAQTPELEALRAQMQNSMNMIDSWIERTRREGGVRANTDIRDLRRDKAGHAEEYLAEARSGEVKGALYHPEVGDIDLVWGKAGTIDKVGSGYADFITYHPYVENLQAKLDRLSVAFEAKDRVTLISRDPNDQYTIKLAYDKDNKRWYFDAYETKAVDRADALEGVRGTQTPRADRAERVKGDLAAIDPATLTNKQKLVREVYLGNQPETLLRGKDESDLITLFNGSKKSGARKILLRHGGTDAVGGLTPSEMLDVGDIVRNGALAPDSFSLEKNSIRYGYDLTRDNVRFRVIIEEFNDGKKIFDYYSDRNIKTQTPESIPQRVWATETIADRPPESQTPTQAPGMRNYIEQGYEPIMARVIDEQARQSDLKAGLGSPKRLARFGAESDGYGLSKIAKFHPEVLDDLQGHLGGMSVKSRTDNRAILESPTHKALVSLNYNGQNKKWLLSEYEKKGSLPSRSIYLSEDPSKKGDGSTPPSKTSGETLPQPAPKVKEGKTLKTIAPLGFIAPTIAALFGLNDETPLEAANNQSNKRGSNERLFNQSAT